ncbi:hypothetical protein GARC_4264 [Paraglaciecola arctica BSs20135]|uniref:DUF11 domain-containing protein n=1 Tax=Paraglaciecola arctica BSs20135 TaxID=493475 RepID=K6YB76_9ALTE|nr:hypothetical protein GARC_4264 [Paraglaciecola arctica BSs20135]
MSYYITLTNSGNEAVDNVQVTAMILEGIDLNNPGEQPTVNFLLIIAWLNQVLL